MSKWISALALAIGLTWIVVPSAQGPSAPATGDGPGGIILYSGSQWNGARLVVHEREISNLGEVGWNDTVKSFTVTAGTWYLYRDDNYWGRNPHDVFGPFTATNGVISGTGHHTFGDNPDSASGNTTSLRRMPESGVTLFEHSYFRGQMKNYTTSTPDLIHAPGFYTRLGAAAVERLLLPYVKSQNFLFGEWLTALYGTNRLLRLGDKASSYLIHSGQWTGYDGLAFTGAATPLNGTPIRNDALSSLFLRNDRRGSEVVNIDDRLTRPRNHIANDSGAWGRGNEIVTRMAIRLNGFGGTFYTTCGTPGTAAQKAFFHIQHMVRLPNKDGRAYFMVAMSNSSTDLDRAEGFIAAFRMDQDAYDPVTDLIKDTPGTDGEYVWSLPFNNASAIGDWNHPGKMDVLGDVLVVAGEQWGSAYCDARAGTDLDAVLFFDVRDPENPKYWGKLTANDLGTKLIPVESLGNLKSIPDYECNLGIPPECTEISHPNPVARTRRVINTVALTSLNDEILLIAGEQGATPKIFRAKNKTVSPNLDNWVEVGTGPGTVMSHGMNFNSYEKNATDSTAGTERIMFFDGDDSGPNANFYDVKFNGGLSIPASGPVTGAAPGKSGSPYPWPKGAAAQKATDAATLYVTHQGRPVIYAPNAIDALPPLAVDYVNGVAVTPPAFSLQAVRVNRSFWEDAGAVILDGVNDVICVGGLLCDEPIDTSRAIQYYGAYNVFYQVHLPDPPTTVTTLNDSGPGSLRQVMADANAGTAIDFFSGLSGGQIRLTTGEISTGKALAIDASRLPLGITVSGNNASRVFRVTSSGRLTLNNTTITGGRADSGGGIFNEGTVRLIRSRVTNSSATQSGGGIWNAAGVVSLLDSTISSNTATTMGGGIGNLSTGGVIVVETSTISGNQSGQGGGIFSFNGTLQVRNSTIAANTAPSGGSGIYAAGATRLRLWQSTIANDVVATAGTTVEMVNAIASTVSGNFKAVGANLVVSHSGTVSDGPAPLTTAALLLGALQDNGGPTWTMLPQSGSFAIDRGFRLTTSVTDQRGLPRGAVPDIGAVESPDLNLAYLQVSGTSLTPGLSPATSNYAGTVSYRTNQLLVSVDGTAKDRILEVSVNGGAFRPLTGGFGRSVDLNVGLNNIVVRVSLADRSLFKEVTIAATREAPSANAELWWLATSRMSVTPNFGPGVTSYDLGTTADKTLRLWGEPQESVANVEVRVNGGAFVAIPSATTIAAGDAHSLAIRPGFGIAGWGSNLEQTTSLRVNQGTPPDHVGDAIAVAAGGSHSLALRSGGEVIGWGSNAFGQISPPPMSGVLAIAAGREHSLALVSTAGGRVVAWGGNSRGQATVPAAALSGVIRIAAGEYHSVALKANGTVVVWGDNFYQQVSSLPAGLGGVVAISAGYDHSLALKSDGTVVRWGTSGNGLSNVPSTLHGVVAIAAGDGVSLALKGDGTVVAWGALADCESESLVRGVTALSAGGDHRLGVLTDGQVFAWGSNSAQQTNVPAGLRVPVPTSPLLALNPGANTVEVKVTAENGTTRVYTLTVTQDDAAIGDSYEFAPTNLDDVITGSTRVYRNTTLIGWTAHFRVTGALAGNIWGTDVYALRSDIAQAAVHAGILAPGETGLVSIRIVASPNEFVGSTRNGVTSRNEAFTPVPSPQTAFTIHPFLGDPFEHLRTTYGIAPGLPPADLRCYANREGETLSFLVFGNAPRDPSTPDNDQAIWYQRSANRYTHDSSLATAAVHAGVLEAGEMGVVSVTIGGQFSFNQADLATDTQLQNGVVPYKRGDDHSSAVEASFQFGTVVGVGSLNDSDADGLSDAQEAAAGLKIFSADTDGDGMLDGWEVAHGLNPLVDDAGGDPDGDGLTNGKEFEIGTDPRDADSDDDGLSDGWEAQFGLNSRLDDAGADPDGDGFGNAKEAQFGTNPLVWNRFFTRYLAEGATSSFFDTRLALLNPENADTTAMLTFLRSGTGSVVHTVPVPARTRVTLDPKTISGMASAEFSTTIDSTESLIVDRTMLWNADGHLYGAHAETAIASPSTIWYLAEGSTNGGFQLFYLLQNPAPTATTVRVRYLRGTGAPLEKAYSLPPNSRTNIWVNEEDFPGAGKLLAAADVSAVVESLDATPIIVERAMYLNSQGRTFNAGHESAGVTAPATSWFLAEGATGAFFDLFVLVANPNPQDALVRVDYLLADGRTYTKTMTAPANSRSNIWVDYESFDGGATYPLADVAVSTTVASTNDVPIIVERAMWWPGSFATWYEGHNSAGSVATGTRWALADGEVGGADNTETYILVANVSPYAGTARVTLMFEDGSSLVQDYPLTPNSRTNVAVGPDFGAAVNGRRFGAVVESVGTTPAQIVVERAMYSGAADPQWRAGTNALATRLQ